MVGTALGLYIVSEVIDHPQVIIARIADVLVAAVREILYALIDDRGFIYGGMGAGDTFGGVKVRMEGWKGKFVTKCSPRLRRFRSSKWRQWLRTSQIRVGRKRRSFPDSPWWRGHLNRVNRAALLDDAE